MTRRTIFGNLSKKEWESNVTLRRSSVLFDPAYWEWIVPEIGRFTTNGARRAAWQAIFGRKDILGRWICFFALTLLIIMKTIPSLFWSSPGLPFTIGLYLVWAATSHFMFVLIWRRRIGRHLKDRLKKLGLCAECGYDLRGSFAKLCPECGASIPQVP